MSKVIDLTILMHRAVTLAQEFAGATAPNPPVGAIATDADGKVLAEEAHRKAGSPHAEAALLEHCKNQGVLDKVHTVVVTLEPCNHHGKTPPCTQALIDAGVKRVVFGARDPNPNVKGQGLQALRDAGIEVVEDVLPDECERLIRGFRHWVTKNRPWITLKTAHLPDGSMIPPEGQKTFTSQQSLNLAHRLRKEADAIITGSGTVLADYPKFTVRLVEDHHAKKRWLFVMDRRGRVPADWIEQAGDRGFEVITDKTLDEALEFLGNNGALEVLVEAGPTLFEEILSRGLWNEHVRITQGTPDVVEVLTNV